MQQAQTAELAPPLSNRIGAAYGQVIRQTESPRDLELRLLAMITAEMESVSTATPPGERARILGRNSEMWTIFRFCAIDDNNQLPTELRAKIASLGTWVDQQSGPILRDNSSLAPLIELNKTIMRGLADGPAGGS
jgi:flagellar biosynthesis activator protein FlaF